VSWTKPKQISGGPLVQSNIRFFSPKFTKLRVRTRALETKHDGGSQTMPKVTNEQ